ncbi:MAG: helix-turn-helix domain-containing protein [Patescibacteria group bacterium]
MVVEKLQKLGLSGKEALIYKALFELGSSVVTDVAERAQINRSTAYVLIESLSKRGLVSVSERRGIKIFSPVAPERLTKIAEARFKEASEVLKIGKEISADLQKLSRPEKTSSKTAMNVFEGVEGIKTVYKQILSAKGHANTVIAITNEKTSGGKPFDLQTYFEKGPASRIVLRDSALTREKLQQMKISKNQEVLLVPEIDGDYLLSVYGNTVAFISPADKTSFVAEDSGFARAINQLFSLTAQKAYIWDAKKGSSTSQSNAEKNNKALVHAEKRFWNGK